MPQLWTTFLYPVNSSELRAGAVMVVGRGWELRGHSYEFLCTRLVEPPGIDLKPHANGCSIVGSRCVGLHVAKSLTSLNFAQQLPTTRSNMQQGVQSDATCNIQQCCVRLHGA